MGKRVRISGEQVILRPKKGSLANVRCEQNYQARQVAGKTSRLGNEMKSTELLGP